MIEHIRVRLAGTASDKRRSGSHAAPLILLAQKRQADRDKLAAADLAQIAVAQREHVERETGDLRTLLQANTALTERIAQLTTAVHMVTCGPRRPDAPAAGNASPTA